MTIGSPPAMTRSPGSWCGEALLGPEATIENSARSWPSATRRSRTSRATSASVRPTSGPAATAATTRSAAWAAAAQQGDLVGVLAHAQRPQDARRHGEPRPGQHPLEAQDERRPQPVRDGHRADLAGRPSRWPPPAGRRPAPSGPRSPPRSRSPAHRPRPRAGAGGRGLQPRGDERERRAVGGRHHEQRQALQRQGLVAGQVPQVRADADQQRVETRRAGHPRARPRAAPRTARRGCRGHRASSSRPAREAGDPGAELAVAVLEQRAIGVDARRRRPPAPRAAAPRRRAGRRRPPGRRPRPAARSAARPS